MVVIRMLLTITIHMPLVLDITQGHIVDGEQCQVAPIIAINLQTLELQEVVPHLDQSLILLSLCSGILQLLLVHLDLLRLDLVALVPGQAQVVVLGGHIKPLWWYKVNHIKEDAEY